MPTFTAIQSTFAGGELAPNLFGRVDMDKYKTATALARNFYVDFRGGLSNRPGTQECYALNPALDPPYGVTSFNPRLIPFIVDIDDAWAMLLGSGYAQFVQNGLIYNNPVAGGVMQISLPYALEDLGAIKLTQSADVMTLTHPKYPPQQITLGTNGVFTVAPVVTAPQMVPPTGLTGIPPGTTNPDYCYCYVVTAVSPDGKRESLPCAPILVHYTILDQTKGFVIPLIWTATSSEFSVYRVYKAGPFDDRVSTGPASSWGFIGDSQTVTFLDNNIAPDFSQQPPQWGDPFDGGQFLQINVNAGGSGYPAGPSWTGYIPLTITDPTGSGASGFATTNYLGVVTGVFLQNPGRNYTSPTITAGSGGATFTWTLSPYSLTNENDFNYPAAVSYFQQRQVFGGSFAKPVTMDFTQVGDYNSFNFSPVAQDNDAMVVDIATTQVNTIQAFQPVSYGLLVFTQGGLFLCSGGNQSIAVTPSNVVIQPQASNGANNLPPILINWSVLYMQAKGNIVRNAEFAWQRQSYVGSDISTFSNHLFTTYTIYDWAYNEEPYKQVYATRNDGTLNVLAYVPDQQLIGWTHYDTNGMFLSVCSIPEGLYNTTYVLTARNINGTWLRFIERFDSRTFTRLEDAWFVDCALASPMISSVNSASPDSIVFMTAGTAPGTVNISGAALSGIAVNDIFWANGGNGTVISAGAFAVLQVDQPFPNQPNDPTNGYPPLVPGTWEFGPQITEVSGLDYLDGMIVTGLMDGRVIPPTVVFEGSITLPGPASKVIVGLGYQSQMQTLRGTTGDNPVTEGKRKTIPAVTTRVYNTLGLKIGVDFTDLNYIPELELPYTPPPVAQTGDFRALITSDWTTNEQICYQVDDPLPVTILDYIPEVLLGDNQR